jgi:hypothetical protein
VEAEQDQTFMQSVPDKKKMGTVRDRPLKGICQEKIIKELGDVLKFFHLFFFSETSSASPFNCFGVRSSRQSPKKHRDRFTQGWFHLRSDANCAKAPRLNHSKPTRKQKGPFFLRIGFV